MERFFAILLLIGGLAGAAAFAHHAGAPADSSFAAPSVQPASDGASSDVLTIAPLPAERAAARRSIPSPRPLRLVTPVRPLVVPAPAPVHVVQAAVSAHPARPAPEPTAAAAPPEPAPAPAPAPTPAPAPAPAAPPVTVPAAVPVVPRAVTPPATAHDHGNGKDRGKARGKTTNDVAVTPVAETAAPVETVTTPTTPAPAPEVVAPSDGGEQHGRGHANKDK